MTSTAADDRPACLLEQGRVTDREGVKAYSASLPPICRNHGGEYLALAPAPLIEVLGDEPEMRSVIGARFPPRAAARAFWPSPQYAAAKPLRAGKGALFVCVLEGRPAAAA